jgi:hypothetical protein
MMAANDMARRNLIAQWAFDTRPILGRFHLWLEDVEVKWISGEGLRELRDVISFVGGGMERLFTMTAGVTALGTRLFGRYGEGAGLDKQGLNRVKKDADAISAYLMSECLWYLTRTLPENHAVMVCLGEGLMPKAGETPEMGSNPMLGFGRIYARPEVAKFLDRQVRKLINNQFSWSEFQSRIDVAGITIWGTAIDTLENTSRFAQGALTGPLAVLHVFDQPLSVTKPYEGYMGNLILPREVSRAAAGDSLLIDFHTPRALVLQACRKAWPDLEPRNIHVWTLGGKSRVDRIGDLWNEWKAVGAHVAEEGWILPSGRALFNDSGTYSPTQIVRAWQDEQGVRHLFLVDGYAASAEAMQAASLGPILGLDVFLAVFSSTFKLPFRREGEVMQLDPGDEEFAVKLARILGEPVDASIEKTYRGYIRDVTEANIPLDKRFLTADDFLPRKRWDVMALSGYMLDDPYVGGPGVEKIDDDTYKVTVRLSTPRGIKQVTLTLRFMEPPPVRRLICNPLLNRFLRGENHQERPVKISDSGRIRNELQTLCSDALDHFGESGVRVHFDRIPPDVISPEDQKRLREVLRWYKEHHPLWFSWLELA